MLNLKRSELKKRLLAAYPWRTWSREYHLAYGLARGVPYLAMERTCESAPSLYWIGCVYYDVFGHRIEGVKDDRTTQAKAIAEQLRPLVTPNIKVHAPKEQSDAA